MALSQSFNLLRRYAVIPTRPRPADRRDECVSISYGDMQSFRPRAIGSVGETVTMFQSPTEICSHSDMRTYIGCTVQVVVSISYGDMQSFRLRRGRSGKRVSSVSISYGDMQSFRRGYLHNREPCVLSVSISYGDMQSFRPAAGSYARQSRGKGFNLLRRYAVIPTECQILYSRVSISYERYLRHGQRAVMALVLVSISYGDMQSFRLQKITANAPELSFNYGGSHSDG